jgi:serine/threonine-protein kinase
MHQVGDIIQTGPGARFQLQRHIASATYGSVWSALWLEAGSSVALKTVRYDRIEAADAQDAGLWPQSLQREIDFLESIRAAHLVYFLRKGVVAGMPVLVLEEMDCSLQHWLHPDKQAAARKVALPQALQWLQHMTLGVQAMHKRGLRHMDLKPGNLLLTADGPLGRRLKIADFGEARPAAMHLHRACGTPGWQAPEQFFPVQDTEQGFIYQTDYRADFFALGLLFFYMVTGEKTRFAKHMLALNQQTQEVAAWQARNEKTSTFDHQDRALFLRALGVVPTQGMQALLSQFDDDATWRPEASVQHPVAERQTPYASTLALLESLLAARPEQRPLHADALITLIGQCGTM